LQSHCSRILTVQAFAAAVLLTRWPLLPESLANFDQANFAFALTDFNPAEHKPQPPGYPLFVGLTQFIALYIEHEPLIFFVAGLVGAVLAFVLLAKFVEDVAGATAGWVAAALLLVHPAMWTASLLNPVRVYLATGTALLGFLAWRSLQSANGALWQYLAFGGLGVAAGFRPTLITLLLPLLLYCGYRRRSTAAEWLGSFGLLAAGVLSWAAVTAMAAGGRDAYLTLVGSYLTEQSDRTSVLFGGHWAESLKMAGRAILWACTPALTCVFLLPAQRAGAWRPLVEKTGMFLIVWSAPAWIVSTLIHSAEPGHVLPMVVPICAAQGMLVAHALPALVAARVIAVATVLFVSAGLFFWPPTAVHRISSAQAVRLAGSDAGLGVSLVREWISKGPVAVIASPSAGVSWRVLSYYFPEVPITVLHSDPRSGSTGRPGYWVVRHGRLDPAAHADTLPSSGRYLWFLHKESPLPVIAGSTVDQRRIGHAIVTEAAPGLLVSVAPYRFRSGIAVEMRQARVH
jgi:hypothetical protein